MSSNIFNADMFDRILAIVAVFACLILGHYWPNDIMRIDKAQDILLGILIGRYGAPVVSTAYSAMKEKIAMKKEGEANGDPKNG